MEWLTVNIVLVLAFRASCSLKPPVLGTTGRVPGSPILLKPSTSEARVFQVSVPVCSHENVHRRELQCWVQCSSVLQYQVLRIEYSSIQQQSSHT